MTLLARPGAEDARLEILSAAAVAFDRMGYTRATIDDIADVLGATKGRVYHYYRSKAAIFLDVNFRAARLQIRAVEPVAKGPGTPSERLAGMVRALVALIISDPALFRIGTRALNVDELQVKRSLLPAVDELLEERQVFAGLFDDVIASGIRCGEFRAVEPRLATRFLLGAVYLIAEWARPDVSVPRLGLGEQEIADEAATFVLRGVGQPGAKRKPRRRATEDERSRSALET